MFVIWPSVSNKTLEIYFSSLFKERISFSVKEILFSKVIRRSVFEIASLLRKEIFNISLMCSLYPSSIDVIELVLLFINE